MGFAAAAPIIAAAIGAAGSMAGNKKGGGVSTGTIPSPQQGHLWEKWGPLANAASSFGLGNIQRAGGGTTGGGFSPTIPASSTGYVSGEDVPTGGTFFGRNRLNFPSASDAINYTRWAQQYSDVPNRLNPYRPRMARTPVRSTGTGGGGGNITSLWDIPGYNIPNPEIMMPTAQTMGSISPDVLAGVMKPYQNVEQQLMETLGAGGGLGSARGGFSGQGAAGLGKYWAEAAPSIGNQMWSMIKDPLAQGWQAQLGKNMGMWSEQLQQNKYPWANMPGMVRLGMPTPYAQPGGGGGGKK